MNIRIVMMNRQSRWYLPLIAVMLMLSIAVIASTVLWQLHLLQNRLIHQEATRSVLESGQDIAAGLALYLHDYPEEERGELWTHFSRLIDVMAMSENQLEYVDVSRKGITVYREHVVPLLGVQTNTSDQIRPDLVEPTRQLLQKGTNVLPVVLFSINYVAADGVKDTLTVALRKNAIIREEESATSVIRSLYRMTASTVLISFVTALLVIAWVITREERRSRVRRSQEHLSYAGMLASGIVHDFRNPMSSLRLDVQMLQRETERLAGCRMDRLHQLTGRICNIVERMENMFREVLFISRPENMARDRIVLNALIKDCVMMVTARFEHAHQQLDEELPGRDIVIEAHTDSLRRALMNLLINAEQHAGSEGRIGIFLRTSRHHAVLQITNSGNKIPAKMKRKVFDLFYTTRPGGTGLGLFLARAAIEHNGGRIRLCDHPPYATCFEVILPLPPKGSEVVKEK
ncbi:MAG: hypothetical protein EOL87_03335 [Spartobacteria bacterium]|nr:hypothetical protein [Spartobacteria bacterium]